MWLLKKQAKEDHEEACEILCGNFILSSSLVVSVSFQRFLQKINDCLLLQVDAFTESAFKGNQAAVCFLEKDHERDDSWLQLLAAEFDLPLTCFLTPITGSDPLHPQCFLLRWFTSVAEVRLSNILWYQHLNELTHDYYVDDGFQFSNSKHYTSYLV